MIPISPVMSIKIMLCVLLGLPLDSDTQAMLDKVDEIKNEMKRKNKITNSEKYKTAEERDKAYREFCNRSDEDCYHCPAGDPLVGCIGCHFKWLELEADEEVNNDERENV